MGRFIRTNLVSLAIVGILMAYGIIGTFAAPGLTPWPDPFQSPVSAQEEPENGGDLDDDGAGVQQEHDDAGLPPDHPVCELIGCSEVETIDGLLLNLPDFAAAGIELARQLREEALQRAEEAQQNGNGDENGNGVAPEGVPTGPPDFAPQGPPDFTPQGPEDGNGDNGQGVEDVPVPPTIPPVTIPVAPPDFAPQGPESGNGEIPPVTVPTGPPNGVPNNPDEAEEEE